MKRTDLLKALKTVMPGVDTKGVSLDGADTFVFSEDWIITYNNNVSVSLPFPVGGNFAVKADKFYTAISKMGGEDIEFKVSESDVTLVCGVTTLTAPIIVGDTIKNIVDSVDLSSIEWKTIPDDFLSSVKSCLFSVASNPTYESLQGICIEEKNVFSSDNFRVTGVTMKEPMPGFLMPSMGAKELLKLGEFKEYSISDSWAHFAGKDEVVFSVRLWNNDFPIEQIKGLFPSKDLGNRYKFPDGLSQSLDRASTFSYEEDGGSGGNISLSRVKDNLIVKGEKGGFKIEDKIKIDKKTFPDKFEVMLPYESLKDILNRTKEFYCCENFLYFEVSNFKHIMAVKFD